MSPDNKTQTLFYAYGCSPNFNFVTLAETLLFGGHRRLRRIRAGGLLKAGQSARD